jgi:hypothetical protein
MVDKEGARVLRRQNRSNIMSIQVVSLHAPDPQAETSVAERLELVAVLTRECWLLSGLPMPAYERSAIPVRLVSLDKPRGP